VFWHMRSVSFHPLHNRNSEIFRQGFHMCSSLYLLYNRNEDYASENVIFCPNKEVPPPRHRNGFGAAEGMTSFSFCVKKKCQQKKNRNLHRKQLIRNARTPPPSPSIEKPLFSVIIFLQVKKTHLPEKESCSMTNPIDKVKETPNQPNGS